MNNVQIIWYLIETAIWLNIFYLFYLHYFNLQTYFQWNRFYMLVIVPVSFLFPFIHLSIPFFSDSFIHHFQSEITTFSYQYSQNLVEIPLMENTKAQKTQASRLNLSSIILSLYLIGVFFATILLIIKLLKISYRIKTKPKNNDEKYKIIETNEKEIAYSFLNYIFVNHDFKKLPENKQKQILLHEQIHCNEKHTIDILFFEIIGIILWFNPSMRRIINAQKDIHEYITDRLLTAGKNDKTYSELLLNTAIKNFKALIVSTFSKQSLKNRLLIISSPEDTKILKQRFIGVLPFLFVIILFFGFIKDVTSHIANYDPNAKFTSPVRGKYHLVSSFYENKEQFSGQQKILTSHRQLSIALPGFSTVYATNNGIVSKIKEVENWGLPEIELHIKHNDSLTSIYKHLKISLIQKNDTIIKGQEIAQTGDVRLYPVISYQLLKYNKPIDPLHFFKLK